LKPREPLAKQLVSALDTTKNLNPQSWARKHISAEANSVKLNSILRQWASERGLGWTRDIESFYCEHFDFQYFDRRTEEKTASEYERVRHEFGLDIQRAKQDPENR
jgi:hypothetical protein